MSVIDIHRAHSLDKEHAREAAETLAKDLSKQFDVNYQCIQSCPNGKFIFLVCQDNTLL